MHLHEQQIKDLELKANEIRQTLIEMLAEAGSGHTAGPLGMADIFTALYFHILNHRPDDPLWDERDRLILSNGHIVPIRYATMIHAGYLRPEEKMTLRKFGSRLQGHPERVMLPAMESTSGPLGSGLGQAAGIALGAKMDGKNFRVYCIMSDGEQQTGNIWESVMFAANNRLNNLTAIMDRNNIQINGMTEDVMPLEPMRAKYEAFNWHVIEIDAHNFEDIVDAVEQAKAIYEKPTLILAHTIPGKGIKAIEFDYRWHGVAPGGGPEDKVAKADQARVFLEELRSLRHKLVESGH
jgi:transketolase